MRCRDAFGREVDQPGVGAVGVVVPPEVVGEGGVAGTVYIPLAAHTRAAVVVDLRGIRRNLIVARPATRAVCRVFILGIGTAPLQRSVGIAAHQIVHQRIPALLRGVDHYADAVLVAEVGSEDIGGIVADGTQVFVGSAAPHVLLEGGLQVLFAGGAGVLLLIGVRQVAVRSVGGFLDLVLQVGIPVAVLRQQGRETVFDAVLHVVPDVALGLVADLVAADEAERRIVVHFGRVGSVAPFETRETLVDDDARNLARAVGQARAVAAVGAVGVGQHVHVVAVDVAHEQRVFADAACARADRIALVDGRDRAFAYGELDVLQGDVGVDVVVGELAHPLLLHGNVRCRTRNARNDHRLGDVAQFIAVGGLDQVARGALNEDLHVVVLFEDVVFGRGGLDGDAVFAVVGFEVDGPVRYAVINLCGRALRVLTRIVVLGVAHHDAFEDDVVFDLLVHGIRPAELLECDLTSEGLLRRALQEVEFDGDGLVPAVGEGERHGSRTRDFICGVRLGRDGQTALFALGIHDFETLDPIGVVGLGILDVDRDLREGNVGLDRRDVLAAGSGDDDGRVGELDLGVHERLLLDVDRVAARVHVGAEHEARFAFEAFVEFAFGGDGALSVLRLTAGQADPVGLVDTLDMEGAVGVDVDVERIRIGFDDELLLQRAQFDQGQIVGVVDAAGRRGCAYGRNA